MIKTLHIQHFKSILDLTLDCKRINVFVGEPNVGKSNILEALGLLSFAYYGNRENLGRRLTEFVRFERVEDLFPDSDLDVQVRVEGDAHTFTLGYKDGRFDGTANTGTTSVNIHGSHSGLGLSGNVVEAFKHYKPYRMQTGVSTFPDRDTDSLLPPSGTNLAALLLKHKRLRDVVNGPFLQFGRRIGIRAHENRLELVKSVEDVIVSHPFGLASDTLQRFAYQAAAILTNRGAVVTFEEPEAHAFPFYTKQLAEMMALDDRDNQYFITTHNPYFLMPLLEKAPKDEVAVHVAYMEDYQTKTRRLTQAEISETLGEVDLFSNLDRYIRRA